LGECKIKNYEEVGVLGGFSISSWKLLKNKNMNVQNMERDER